MRAGRRSGIRHRIAQTLLTRTLATCLRVVRQPLRTICRRQGDEEGRGVLLQPVTCGCRLSGSGVKSGFVKRTHKVDEQIEYRESGEPVSELTTNRISVYLRCLNQLDAAGVRTVSSQALAEQFHLNAAQIRKDLAYFGEFGVRGVGYYVKELRRHLRQILGIDRGVCVAIMGAGNLGLALADYPGFRDEGFEIVALFDIARDKVGHRSRAGVPIYDARDLRKIARRERIRIGVVAVPAAAAQAVVDTVAAAGIRAILNFSPGTVKVPDGVKLKSMDLTVSLESLSFFLAQNEEPA
jgi:redox-sensing transcriptional repressor